MINTAKDMSSNVAIAAIPPRLQPAHALGHITALNANPVAMADEMGVLFFDNSEQFFLHNKEVNDGYLFDQVHLTPKRLLFWTCIEDQNGPFKPGNILMQFSQWKT